MKPRTSAIAILALCACSKGAPSPPATVQASLYAAAHACGGPLTLSVTSSVAATVEVAGKQYETDESGKLLKDIPRSDLAGATTVPIRVTTRTGEVSTSTATVSETSPTFLRGEFSGEGLLRVTAIAGTSRLQLTEGKSTPMPGHLQFVVVAEGVGLAAQDPGVVATLDGGSLHVDVDLAAWVRNAGKVPERLEIPVRLAGCDRRPVTLTFAHDGHFGGFGAARNIYTQFVNVATSPFRDAPLPADVPPPRPIVLVYGADRIVFDGPGKPEQAPYIAIVTESSDRVGTCGPYETLDGKQASIGSFRDTTIVKLHEARTGKLVAQNTFVGRMPSCPATISTMTRGTQTSSIDTVHGGVEGVQAWLDKYRR